MLNWQLSLDWSGHKRRSLRRTNFAWASVGIGIVALVEKACSSTMLRFGDVGISWMSGRNGPGHIGQKEEVFLKKERNGDTLYQYKTPVLHNTVSSNTPFSQPLRNCTNLLHWLSMITCHLSYSEISICSCQSCRTMFFTFIFVKICLQQNDVKWMSLISSSALATWDAAWRPMERGFKDSGYHWLDSVQQRSFLPQGGWDEVCIPMKAT